MRLLLPWLLAGCRHPSPPDAPLELPDPSAALASDWGMPLPVVRGFLAHSPDGCPAALTPFPAGTCGQAHPDRGLAPDRPLEWGDGARGTLWHGRLMCASGALPAVERLGNIGVGGYKTESPRSRIGQEQAAMLGEAGDVLDTWLVRCPNEEPRTWYANMYRCGNPCPPAGFSIMDAGAMEAMRRAQAHLEGGRAAEALVSAEQAVEREPRSDVAWLWLGTALSANNRHNEALPAFQRAAEIDPTASSTRYYAAVTARAVRDWPACEAHTDALLGLVGEGHEIYGEALCLKAITLQERGESASSEDFRQRACAAGAAGCCR